MHIVVIGGGQASASLIHRLHELGFEGLVSLFSGETVLPYERPPLSKGALRGEFPPWGVPIYPQSFYDDAGVCLHLGCRVESIDTTAQVITTIKGQCHYDHLVIATGAIARPLPEEVRNGLEKVWQLRSLEDAKALKSELEAGLRLLIIGGGTIGLEIASSARQMGVEVRVVEAASRILQRVASQAMSDEVRNLHTAGGVEVLEGVGVEKLLGQNHGIKAHLTDGRRLDSDRVMASIGALPNVELALGGSIRVENGIWVDSLGKTSAPNVWAVGDCASFPMGLQRIRLESVQHAIEHGEAVAANILGAEQPYVPFPYFWSEQFGSLLQIVGLSSPEMKTVQRKNTSTGSCSNWLYRPDGKLAAVEVLDDSKTFSIARQMIADGLSPSPAEVADLDVNLKRLWKKERANQGIAP